jgi:sulfite reductase alpha subunit-like flavoprotein
MSLLLRTELCEMLKTFDKYLRSRGCMAICFGLIPLVVAYLRHNSRQRLQITAQNKDKEDGSRVTGQESSSLKPTFRKVTLLYGTTTGTSRKLAAQFAKRLNEVEGVVAEIYDMATYNTDMLKEEDLLLLLCSTWSNGFLPEKAHQFLLELEDLVVDFRVSKDLLGTVQYAVFGLGGKLYGEHFCTAAHSVHAALHGLGGKSLMPPVCGDDQTDLEQKFDNWCIRVESEVVTSVDSRIVAKKQSDKKKANKGPRSYESPPIQYVTSESSKTSKGKLRKVKGSVREKKRAAYKAAKEKGEVPDHPNRHENKSVQSAADVIAQEEQQRREGNMVDASEVEVEEEDLINDTFCRVDSDDEDADAAATAEARRRKGEGMTDLEDLGSACTGWI